MGFLKFLKREKKHEFDELDLPPAPPPLEGFEEKTDFDFPAFDEKQISVKEDELPKFDFPEDEAMPEPIKGENEPDFPSFPDVEESPMPEIVPVSAPAAPEPAQQAHPLMEEGLQDTIPAQSQSDISPDYARPRKLFGHKKKHPREYGKKEIYVRIDKFKAALDNISSIRSSLRKSEEALIKLEGIKNSKDRSFEKFKSSIDDMQKKLIFIDKTLFKGD